MESSPETIAIIGGGPAGSTLASFLGGNGYDVAMFYDSDPSTISVGESLVPGVIPILRELGVEEEVKSYSAYKPGACFYLREDPELKFDFGDYSDLFPPYAYNVPRNEFNKTLRQNASESGAHLIEQRVELERRDEDSLRLSSESLKQADPVFDGQPDLIVDATGRARLISTFLDLPTERGNREDVAFFTHFDHIDETTEGHVHTDLLDHGWNWRIPLEDRVSFGMVMGEGKVPDRNSPEEQLGALIDRYPRLRRITGDSERLEPVFKYKNYQLITKKMVGKNWALLGDAAGFVDPVFSSGMFIALNSARELFEAINKGTESAFQQYEESVLHHIEAWQEIANNFYNGRLMTLLKTGQDVKGSLLGKIVSPHIGKHMARVFTGGAAQSRYSMWLLRFMTQCGLKGNDPDELALDKKNRSKERNVVYSTT